MADKYTLKEYTEEELSTIDDKNKIVTREFSELHTKPYTIASLENAIANCDAYIEQETKRKESYKSILDLVKEKIDE